MIYIYIYLSYIYIYHISKSGTCRLPYKIQGVHRWLNCLQVLYHPLLQTLRALQFDWLLIATHLQRFWKSGRFQVFLPGAFPCCRLLSTDWDDVSFCRFTRFTASLFTGLCFVCHHHSNCQNQGAQNPMNKL